MRLPPYRLLLLALLIGCASLHVEAQQPVGALTQSPPPPPPPPPSATPAPQAPAPPGPYAEEQLVELAVRNHAGLAAARAAVDVARANQGVVAQPIDPQARLTYRDTTRTATGGRSEQEDMLEAGVRFYLRHPFEVRALRQGAATALHAAEADAEFMAQQVRQAVRRLVREIAGLRREQELAEQTLALTERVGETIEQRRASAQATAPEVLTAGFAMLDAAAERDRVEKALRSRLGDLRAYLGITLSGPEQILLPPAAPRWSEADLDTARLLEMARAYRLELRALRWRRESGKAALKAALSRRIPWFQFVEGDYREESGVTDSDAWTLSTALSLPVVTAMGRQADLRQAEILQAQAALAEGESDVESQVISAREAVLAAGMALQRFEEVMMPLLEEATRGVAESEARRDLPVDTQLALEQSLLKAQRSFLSVQQDYESAALDLQQAVGVVDLHQALHADPMPSVGP